MRAIDADQLIKDIEEMRDRLYDEPQTESWGRLCEVFRIIVIAAPTVEDGHQITRCKECKHRTKDESGQYYCASGMRRSVDLDNWFCGSAEKDAQEIRPCKICNP